MPSSLTSGQMTRRDVLRGLAAVGVGAAAGAAAHGFLYGRHRIAVTRTTLTVSGLPEALSGLRVGFLTDLHRSETVPHELIEAAVRTLMAEGPDLIVLGGDYVTWRDRRFVQPAAEALAPLSAPFGVFGVLGNHDDDQDMPAALADRGITILRDARTRITIRGETLDLIGIRYWTRRMADIARIARGAGPTSISPGPHTIAACGSVGAGRAVDAEWAYPRWPGRAARPGTAGGQELSSDRRGRSP